MKKAILIVMIILTLIFTAACSSSEETTGAAFRFTDDQGREVTLQSTARIGFASGSFAECYMLAGGTPAAVTNDAVTERNLSLPEETVNLGSLRKPSSEAILEADLDLMVLVPSIKNHSDLAASLEKAGIPYAYFEVETFDQYLNMLKIFTDMTGREDLYQKNGLDIQESIASNIEKYSLQTPADYLLLRASTSSVSIKGSDTIAGKILDDLGCMNIAEKNDSLLKRSDLELNMEVILEENPDYIFITCMGNEKKAKAQFDHLIDSDPAWKTLDAIENSRYYFLEKELFHYKPNARWGESYEVLGKILQQN